MSEVLLALREAKETLDRLAKMYALDYNKSDAKEIRNALFK